MVHCVVLELWGPSAEPRLKFDVESEADVEAKIFGFDRPRSCDVVLGLGILASGLGWGQNVCQNVRFEARQATLLALSSRQKFWLWGQRKQ